VYHGMVWYGMVWDVSWCRLQHTAPCRIPRASTKVHGVTFLNPVYACILPTSYLANFCARRSGEQIITECCLLTSDRITEIWYVWFVFDTAACFDCPHQVGHWYTRRVRGERGVSLQTVSVMLLYSNCNVIVRLVYSYCTVSVQLLYS
jgi:hypothetical protein